MIVQSGVTEDSPLRLPVGATGGPEPGSSNPVSPGTPKRRERLEILHNHFTESDLAPAISAGS